MLEETGTHPTTRQGRGREPGQGRGLSRCLPQIRPIFLTTIHQTVSTTSQVKPTTPKGVRIWVVCLFLMPDYYGSCVALMQVTSCLPVTTWLELQKVVKASVCLHSRHKHPQCLPAMEPACTGHVRRWKGKLAFSSSEQLVGNSHRKVYRGRPQTATGGVRHNTTLDHWQ